MMWGYKELQFNRGRRPDKVWTSEDNSAIIRLIATDYPGGLTKYDVTLHSKGLDDSKSFGDEEKALNQVKEYAKMFGEVMPRKKKSHKPKMKSKKCKCKN